MPARMSPLQELGISIVHLAVVEPAEERRFFECVNPDIECEVHQSVELVL